MKIVHFHQHADIAICGDGFFDLWHEMLVIAFVQLARQPHFDEFHPPVPLNTMVMPRSPASRAKIKKADATEHHGRSVASATS